ncbi:MAG TPA: M28 family peptidase [Ignavibacteriaceae bacterium]|nr:M28 family peptidase [Ignavibacteriaceae bacterium]
MKKLFLLLFALVGFSFAQNLHNPDITAPEIQSHINYLASDELQGRMTGTPELYKAADYLKKEFESYGLKPLFDGSYFQEFPFIEKLELGTNNFLSIDIKKGITPGGYDAKLKDEFIPLSFTDNQTAEGELVFAGYGISAKDLNYDDYANIDVKDKIVVVFRNHPDMKSPHSKFEQYSSLRYKTTNARDKGAKGIIFVNTNEKPDDQLIALKYDNAAKISEICAVQIKRDLLNFIPLNDLQNEIDSTLTPNSFKVDPTATITITTEVNEVKGKSVNVGAYVEPVNDKYPDEYLVIGAHFDHLGWGTENSLYTGAPMIHNGADDNASGTSGILELAEKFAAAKDKINRKIVFISFSGEELGLLGSAYVVNHFPLPIEKDIAMLNMDMIGRLNDKNDLIVYGTGTSSNWKSILDDKNEYDFTLTFNDEGFGPSDQSSFYGKKIPVLFFFTGTHSDYHKPSDDADKINSKGEEKVVKYVYDIASTIANTDKIPDYISVERKDTGRMGGSRVYVGTVPDFAGDVDGYKLGGVTDGSPAAKAGLKAGDIIIQFGDKKISNIYDFTYAIGNYVPGDKVNVIVKRGDELLNVEIILGSR